MSLEWNDVVLKDVLSEKGYIRGPFGSALKRAEMKSEGIPVYEQQNAIYDNRIFRYFIDEEKYQSLKRFTTYPDDLIISCSGTVGKVSIIKHDDPKGIISQALLTLRVNKDLILPEFLKYFFSSYEGYNSLVSRSTGSVQVNISKRAVIEEIPLKLPPLDVQQKIVYYLSLIDKKIGINEKINKNLHLLSKNIFKYYMEDFCPFLENGMQNSELGNIPIDWKVHDFNSIADIFNGYSYKGNELQPSNSAMATIKNFNRDGSFRSDGFKEIVYSEKIKEQHFVNENDVLVSCTDVTQDADIIGNCVLLLDKRGYNEVIMSMDLVKVESKIPEINNFLLAAILKSYRFKMHILGYVNGTTVLHLDKKGIKKFRLALPSDLSILKDLSNIMEQIYNQISINMKEINNLTKLRDTLLPKLMSGEIDVSKINCDMPPKTQENCINNFTSLQQNKLVEVII